MSKYENDTALDLDIAVEVGLLIAEFASRGVSTAEAVQAIRRVLMRADSL